MPMTAYEERTNHLLIEVFDDKEKLIFTTSIGFFTELNKFSVEEDYMLRSMIDKSLGYVLPYGQSHCVARPYRFKYHSVAYPCMEKGCYYRFYDEVLYYVAMNTDCMPEIVDGEINWSEVTEVLDK